MGQCIPRPAACAWILDHRVMMTAVPVIVIPVMMVMMMLLLPVILVTRVMRSVQLLTQSLVTVMTLVTVVLLLLLVIVHLLLLVSLLLLLRVVRVVVLIEMVITVILVLRRFDGQRDCSSGSRGCRYGSQDALMIAVLLFCSRCLLTVGIRIHGLLLLLLRLMAVLVIERVMSTSL